MIDVSLFRTPAFSAASGSVTVAFFALFGFIFLVTQYFQFIRGYGTLSTGVRILPVAITIALGSVVGVVLAGRHRHPPVVVTAACCCLASSFGWIALSPTFMPYDQIVGQMVLMGLGLGLTTAPATESILSVLPPAKAGVGSAVNDATREAGGTLGVAVLGSIFTSLYAGHIATSAFAALPAPVGRPRRTRSPPRWARSAGSPVSRPGRCCGRRCTPRSCPASTWRASSPPASAWSARPVR